MLTYVSTRRDLPAPEKEQIMQASKMTVGTVYLVDGSPEWRRRTYNSKAYRLMSLNKMGSNTHFRGSKAEVTIDGVTYVHFGRPYVKGFGGEAKYLAMEVDPKTGESIGKEYDGKPFLALISAREVRGPWAEAFGEAEAERKEAAEYERKRREGSRESLGRAEGLANRFRALLGITEAYSSKVKVDTFSSSGVTWGSGVTLRSEQAEAVLDRLEAAEARVAELESIIERAAQRR